MKNRIVSFILAAVVVFSLTSCQNKSIETRQKINQNIRVSYFNDNDEETVKALEIFSEKIGKLSSGKMTMDYNASVNPVIDMKNNRADIIIINSEMLGEYGKEFKMFTSPFFFLNPLQSTMTLNSEEFTNEYKEYFSKNMGCVFLGSVYLSSELAASQSEYITSFKNIENSIFAVNGKDRELLEMLDYYSLEYFGANTEEYEEYMDRQESKPNIIRIVNIDEISRVFDHPCTIYVPEYPYKVSSQWILINEEYWNSVSENEKYIIKQAVSYFSAVAEGERLKKYEDLYFDLSDNKINMIETKAAEIRMDVQSYVKYSSKTYEGIDVNLYNEITNIIS